jgi:hypothetical protein
VEFDAFALAGVPIPGAGNEADAPAAVMPNGQVLFFTANSELLDFDPNAPQDGNAVYTLLGPSSGSLFPDLSHTNNITTSMLVVPNGHVLFSTGNQLWDYTPDDMAPAATLPAITVTNVQPNGNGSYSLSGNYLTGFSEGAAQGDQFNGSATNYPIVKLTLGTRVWYAKTTGWTPGVYDSASYTNVQFTPPADLPAGNFSLQVVASGIASAPVNFTSTTSPVYADAAWASMSGGAQIDLPDPLAPGSQIGHIGDNCFGTVNDAITRAAQLGVAVVVNGSDGVNDSGAFSENVAVNSQVPLYLQRGPVHFGLLSSAAGDPTPAAAQVILNDVTLTVGGGFFYVDSCEYDGMITGSGGLIEDGAYGALTLGGIDNTSGATTVSSGSLVVAGSITGFGGVAVDGGILQPGTANSLAAETVTLNAGGSLVLGSLTAATLGGLAGSGALNLGTTTLTVGGDGETTIYAGALTGTGPLVKVGAGIMTFAGTGSTIPITVNDGSIQPSAVNALAGDTVTLNVGYDSTTNQFLGLDLRAVSAATLGGLAGNGAINLGDQNTPAAALTVGANSGDTTYDGLISGTGSLTKAGTGTLKLTATDGLSDGIYGGATVSAGTLQVAGTLNITLPAVLTVAAGAVLVGPGTINAVVNAAGTVQGGSSAGRGQLSIENALSFQPSAVVAAELNGTSVGTGSTTGYDQVNAVGDIQLNGAILDLTLAPSYVPIAGESFDLVHNTFVFTLSGKFTNAPSSGSIVAAGGQYFRIDYSSHDVTATDITAVSAVAISDGVSGDGTSQRSEVRQIAVTFSRGVTFAGGNANAAAAFQLQHVQDSAYVNNLAAAVTTNTSGQTVVTLTFTTTGNASAEIDPVSAENGAAPSLADGRYQLTILSADVTDAYGQALNGGGNYVSPTDAQGGGAGQLRLFRLFGDVNGDGVVNQVDLGIFRAANNSTYLDPAYIAFLDANYNGSIDQIDLGEFRARNNTTVF